MNPFLLSTKQLISANGESANYLAVTNGVYDPSTSEVINSEVATGIIVYRKHLKATQYNYPSLIGKDSILVYIPADALLNAPSVNDKIVFGLDTYAVDSVQEHRALNQVVLYRVACYRG